MAKGNPRRSRRLPDSIGRLRQKPRPKRTHASETELEVAPKPPAVKAPEVPKDNGDNISIPTPVKPGKGEPTLGEPPVLEPDDPVSIWVDINQSHIGTTADYAADWHFVLVGLGKGASPARLTAVFEKAGEIVVDPSKINAADAALQYRPSCW
jgi:hypothetical protein